MTILTTPKMGFTMALSQRVEWVKALKHLLILN